MDRALTQLQTRVAPTTSASKTLNQILTEMDGFTGNEGVIVLAATNRPRRSSTRRCCARVRSTRAGITVNTRPTQEG